MSVVHVDDPERATPYLLPLLSTSDAALGIFDSECTDARNRQQRAEGAHAVSSEAESRQRAHDLAAVLEELADAASYYSTDVFPEDSTTLDSKSAKFARGLIAGLKERLVARLGTPMGGRRNDAVK